MSARTHAGREGDRDPDHPLPLRDQHAAAGPLRHAAPRRDERYTYIYPAVAIILSPRYALLIDPLEVRSATARSRLRGSLLCFLSSLFGRRS
jgi:hypothetical protein